MEGSVNNEKGQEDEMTEMYIPGLMSTSLFVLLPNVSERSVRERS